MTNKPKPGPATSTEPLVPSEPDPRPVAEYEADHEAKAVERDRTSPRMSEGTRQDILQFGRVQDPHDPTRWLTEADIPK